MGNIICCGEKQPDTETSGGPDEQHVSENRHENARQLPARAAIPYDYPDTARSSISSRQTSNANVLRASINSVTSVPARAAIPYAYPNTDRSSISSRQTTNANKTRTSINSVTSVPARAVIPNDYPHTNRSSISTRQTTNGSETRTAAGPILPETSVINTIHNHMITVPTTNVTPDLQTSTVNLQSNSGTSNAKQEVKIPFKSYMPRYETQHFFNADFKNYKATNSNGYRLLRLISELKTKSNTLTQQNYLDALLLFVDIEDLYCEVAIRVYNRKNEQIKSSLKFGDYIMIIPNLLESCPPISIGGRLTITTPEIETPIYGLISEMLNDYIVVQFKNPIDTDIRYDVEFLSNRTTYRMEKLAIDLMKQKNLVPFMFPNKDKVQNTKEMSAVPEFTWFNESVMNNIEQQAAITNIYSGTSYPYPYILFGPPGTGKTTTLVESILQLWKNQHNSRILIVATSNFACNVITKRLLAFIPTTEIFRLFSKSQEIAINKIDAEVLDASNLKSKKYYSAQLSELYLYRIIVATPTSTGRLIIDGFDCDHFTHLFVDECGSCTEGSTLIPIAGLISKRNSIRGNIVLAGDPLQLRPVIYSKYAQDLGYSVSMIERLMTLSLYKKDDMIGDYNNKFITKLRVNYRSHKDILHVSNQLFYNSELKALGPKHVTEWILNWEHLPNPKFPIIFEAVFGQSLCEDDSPSLYNQREVDVVLSYLKLLINKKVNGRMVRPSDIGVISPYRKQNHKIRSKFGKRWSDVEVGTVEAFQGSEKSVIILSTVRSNIGTMGFLSNERRLNVALTRAQGVLIIVGDPKVLMIDKCWYHLMKFCYDNKAICGESFDFYE